MGEKREKDKRNKDVKKFNSILEYDKKIECVVCRTTKWNL